MTIYTVIGYREDLYGGHYEDRSGSEIEVQIFESLDDAIDQAFEFMTRTERHYGRYNRQYNDWETRLLVDGRDEDFWLDENDWTQESPFNVFSSRLREKINEWHKEAKTREETAKKEAAEKKKRAEVAAAAEKTKSEKKLLAELKKKYPDA